MEKKQYNSTNKCPICGGEDFCFYFEKWDYKKNKPFFIHLCGRYVHGGPQGKYYHCGNIYEGQTVRGINGKNYVFKGDTLQGYGRFIEEISMFYSNQNKDTIITNKNFANSYNNNGCSSSKKEDVATIEVIHKTYESLLASCTLSIEDREALKEDGWSEELIQTAIKKYKLCSMPKRQERKAICKKLLQKGCTLKGVPGFYEENGEYSFSGLEGIIFPLFNHENKIFALRIRLNHSARKFLAQKEYEKNGKQGALEYYLKKVGKYHNFSSSKGVSSGNHMSIFGREFIDKTNKILIGEGEKKGIVASEFYKVPYLLEPGVSNYNLITKNFSYTNQSIIEYLKDNGIDTVIIMNDADWQTNKNVASATVELAKILFEHNLNPHIGLWDVKLAKGIDDAIFRGVRPRIMPLINK